MTSHLAVLPSDIIQFLTASFQETPEQNHANKGLKKDLRFLRLPHPRTGLPALFLPFRLSEIGPTSVFEVQATAPPDERSWIMEDSVVSDGRLLTITPVDPTFLLSALLRSVFENDSSNNQFRTMEDLFDQALQKFQSLLDPEDSATGNAASPSLNIQDIQYFYSLDCCQTVLSRLCEVKEITAEITVYRYIPDKFMEYLRVKVKHLEQCSALAASRTVTRSLAKDGLMEDGKERLLEVARKRAACDLLSQYISTDVHKALLDSYDFTELDSYSKQNQKDVFDATSADASNKKGAAQDEAKQTTGGKRKKATKASNGVETLKKANIAGMAKLTSFFKKS